MGATTTVAVTRDEIIDDAIAIVQAQGAVKDGVYFWESESGEELWRMEPKEDPGECRVCIAGAIYLAQLRKGLRATDYYGPDGNLANYDDVIRARRELGVTLVDIEDSPETIVRVLEAMR